MALSVPHAGMRAVVAKHACSGHLSCIQRHASSHAHATVAGVLWPSTVSVRLHVHEASGRNAGARRMGSSRRDVCCMAQPPPMRDASGQPNTSQMLVFVPPHPLLKHWLAVARSSATPPQTFRSALAELGRLLIYEAGRDWLPTLSGEVDTPLGKAQVEFVDPTKPVACVPILRAGSVLLEQAATVLPAQVTYHFGVARNEETLQPTVYLNKLPDTFQPDTRVLVTDPMLATGGSLCTCLDALIARGVAVSNLRVVGVVAAPPALKRLSETYPGLRVYVAMIDEELDSRGRIVPGLGDAGDRAFGNTV